MGKDAHTTSCNYGPGGFRKGQHSADTCVVAVARLLQALADSPNAPTTLLQSPDAAPKHPRGTRLQDDAADPLQKRAPNDWYSL